MKLSAPRFHSLWWYVLGVGLAVGGWLAGVVHSAGAWDVVRQSPVTVAAEKFDAAGSHVGVLTDLVQPDREIRCRAVGPKKGQATEIEAAPVDVSVNSDGTRWHLIGITDGRDGMRIRCNPTDKRTDPAVYGYQLISALSDRADTSRFIAVGGALGGILLVSWTAWSRRGRTVEE